MKYWLGVLSASVIAVLAISYADAGAQSSSYPRIESYTINYNLSKGADGSSKLRTLEEINAIFSPNSQNHGIERFIPIRYDGRRLPLTINSVTDENGDWYRILDTETRSEKRLRIGNPNRYVQGEKIYNIDYSQEHVTKYFKDTGRTEWYWNTNGTGWTLDINELNINITIDESIAGSIQEHPHCYIGKAGSTDKCELVAVSDNEYTVSAANMKKGENITVAFGFEKGAFAEYKPPFLERFLDVWVIVTIFTSIIGFGLIISISVLASRRSNRSSELKPTPPEYIPPKNISILASLEVMPSALGSSFASQLIDLAVRRYINVIEVETKGMFLLDKYDIEILKDISPLLEEEKVILEDIFDGTPKVGDRASLHDLKKDAKYRARRRASIKRTKKILKEKHTFRHYVPEDSKYFYKWAVALLIPAILLLAPALLVASGIAFVFGKTIQPFNDEGLALRRYLFGFRKYIKAAEAERLAFLQGPDTADKIGEPFDSSDRKQVVRLYERSLPYAVLYGEVSKWSEALGDYYAQDGSSPNWYVGKGSFNAAAFSISMTGFSSTAASSSGGSGGGGSGGGGSSGGGGGGGGGGAW